MWQPIVLVVVFAVGASALICPIPPCPSECTMTIPIHGCRKCDCPGIGVSSYKSETECAVPDCDYDCGLKIGENGCATCDCSVSPYEDECPNICPQDCGQKRLANGCLKCVCNLSPWD